jgi:two-component system, NarL family, response regulator NreC
LYELKNKEIADRLSLSKRILEGYREKILEKMDVKNTAGIVVYVIKNKIYQ